MSLKDWENKVLSSPGAAGRVAAIEDELRLAAGLTALREEAGLSQWELAKRIGVSQPRVAAEGSDAGCAAEGLDTVQQHGAPGRAQLLEGARTGRSELLIGPHRRCLPLDLPLALILQRPRPSARRNTTDSTERFNAVPSEESSRQGVAVLGEGRSAPYARAQH
jgi:transcriptional regulator with XRE-family HTH domain